MKRAAVIILSLAVAGMGWTALASMSLCWAIQRHDLFVWPFNQWWMLAPLWFGANWYATLLVAVSTILPTVIVGMLLFVLFVCLRWRHRQRRRLVPGCDTTSAVERGTTDNHGHAAWAGKRQIAERFSAPGCLIGAVDRGPKARLLFDDVNAGPGHSLIFAGPGGHKTMTAVHRIWRWNGPRVVFDPSCEIGPMMTAALQDDGCNVVSIGLDGNGLNALDWLDPADGECDAHIRTVVDHVWNSGGAGRSGARGNVDPFWELQGRSLVSCLLAHLMYQSSGPKTLALLREGIALPEADLKTLLAGIHAGSPSSMARGIAGGLMAMGAPETFSGIVANAKAGTDWLGVASYASVVSGDAMRTMDILDPNTVVFVQIPLRTLLATPAVGRAVIGSLFNALFGADGKIPNSVLFQIDEAAILGPLKEIMLCYTTARKYRGCISAIFQSEAQLEETFGREGAKTLRDSAAWRSYNAVQDGDIAERLSRDIGSHAVLAFSEGDNQGQSKPFGLTLGSASRGSNVNIHEISRRLVKVDEIMRAPADEMFVLARNFANPIRCVTAPFFRYPDLAGLMAANRFAKTS